METLSLSAASDLNAFLKLVRTHSTVTGNLAVQAMVEGPAVLRARGEELAKAVELVVRNNPAKDISAMLGRADVQERLAHLSVTSQTRALLVVEGAQLAGYSAGREHLRAEAAMLGLHLPDTSPHKDHTPYVDQVRSDVETITGTLSGNHQVAASGAFHGPHPLNPAADNPQVDRANRRGVSVRQEMERESRRQANRVAAAASVASQRSVNEARLEELKALQEANPSRIISKVWVCQFGPNTCGTCAALHGTVLALDDEFDHGQTFLAGSPPKVYYDLAVPPRHPACRCVVTIHLDGMDAEPMRQQGKEFAKDGKNMAPQSWATGSISNLAKTTDHMQSSDIKAVSDTQFEFAMQSFRECLLASP